MHVMLHSINDGPSNYPYAARDPILQHCQFDTQAATMRRIQQVFNAFVLFVPITSA